MISGLWSNSNLDDGKNTRMEILEGIERGIQETVAKIYGGTYVDADEVEIDYTDPFFAPSKAASEKWGGVAEKTYGQTGLPEDHLNAADIDQ